MVFTMTAALDASSRREPVRPEAAAPHAEQPAGGWVLDDLPDGIVVVGPDERILDLNAKAASLVGGQREELLGAPVRTAFPLQDTSGTAWWACTDPFGGLSSRTGSPERLLLLGADREVFLTARYVRDGRGEPVRKVVLVLREASARRREEQRNSALISTVAHELRSPLTSVKGFTSTLLRRWARFSDDEKRLMLQTIEADTDRVTRLIAELLDVSRLDSGRLEIRRQPLDLAHAVNAHIDRLEASGHDRSGFTVDARPLPEIWADPDRIEQVIANLLENAVRHGGGMVTVTLRPTDDDSAAVVTVEDEGDGIPEESYPMVFTRFWHGGRRSGTGLGLYVVRGIVEAHGGQISVGRAASGGASFRFTLPAGAPEHVA